MKVILLQSDLTTFRGYKRVLERMGYTVFPEDYSFFNDIRDIDHLKEEINKKNDSIDLVLMNLNWYQFDFSEDKNTIDSELNESKSVIKYLSDITTVVVISVRNIGKLVENHKVVWIDRRNIPNPDYLKDFLEDALEGINLVQKAFE